MTKNATTTMNFHINKTLKLRAEKFFNDIGFSSERVLTAFIEQCLEKKKLPIKIKKTPEEIDKEWENKPHIPNARTMKTFKEIDGYFNGKPSKNIHRSIKIKKTPEEIEKEWENKPHIPNKETLRVIKESEDFFNGKPSKNIHRFNSVKEMLDDLNS
jgi:antitoxin component of RelBE/YafQ-DinJ toxin-antitoxin module